MRQALRKQNLLFGPLLLTALLPYGSACSQDLGAIGRQKALRVSGGLNINQVFYGIHGQENRRDPYSYYVSGNLNFTVYGLSMPFSYSFSNQNSSFQQPFNQYSLNPTYKWITGHFGYTSMSFSPYTLNGHLFLGAGLDLAPTDRLKVSIMYGRLQKAVEPDSTDTNVLPAFRRMGFGIRATYGSNENNIGFSLFKAEDDVNSIAYVPEEAGILPEENLVAGLSGTKTLFEHFLLKAEFASTAITRDIRADEADPEHGNVLGKAGGLYTARTSSAYYNAFNASFTYQADRYNLGVGYERIAPGYRTLGAYYFNNDLESITVNAATSILENKVNLSANVGTQRDNLDGEKISGMSRVSASFNVAYTPGKNLTTGLSYSNFRSYTNIRSQFVEINELTPYDNLDTLNYRQISQSANLNVNYIFNTREHIRSALNVNIACQQSDDEQGGAEQPTGARFYNINTAYSLNFVPKKMALVLAFNMNHNDVALIRTNTFGPTVTLTKSLMQQKMRTSLSASWNNAYTNGERVTGIVNLRASGSYTLQKKHSFNISLVGVNRSADTAEGGASDFTEFTGTLGYNYNFSM